MVIYLLLNKKLLAHVFIGLQPHLMVENGQEQVFLALFCCFDSLANAAGVKIL
jgi:hypothetical protein